LLPTGMIALLVSVFVVAEQVPQAPQKTAPPPAATPQKAAAPDKGVAPLEKAERRRGRKGVYLGVFTVPVEDMTARTRKKLKLSNSDGVFVIEVMPDSPADEAGVRHGDVITHVNGKLVEDEDELSKDIHELGPGKKVDLTVIRDGAKKEIKAELEEVPAGHVGIPNGAADGGDEMIGLCHQNAQRIERLERKIERLERRLSEMEKTASK
jgi:membrane-associated protease RseP (regulator of RpoE activity)